MNLEKEIFDISLQDIIPNRFQPREIFKDAELSELSESIKKHGVIQPIIVRKVGDKYEIIAGERRFRASQLAGNDTIPALVRDIDDKEAAKIALLENLQRSNLTPIEEAKTYQTILKIENITQDELATTLGKSQSTIANKMRLLTLNEEVQTALLNSQISERHARSLIGLTNQQQVEMLHRIINEKLTVRQLDEEIMKLNGKIPENEEKGIISKGEIYMDNDMQNQELNINPQSEVLNTTIPGVNSVEQSVQEPPIQESTIPETPVTEQPIQEMPNLQGPAIGNQTTPEPNIEAPVVNMPEIPTVPTVEAGVTVQQPTLEVPTIEVPNQESTTPETSVVEQPVQEAPTQESTTPEVPIVEQPVQETPNQESITPEVPIVEQPVQEAPTQESVIPEAPVVEQPVQEVPTQESITPEVPVVEQSIQEEQSNIFDKLRINREDAPNETKFELKNPDLSAVINENQLENEDIYDLRFAINNFRQAIQNTEKFGFNVTSTEQDNGDKYQIIIEIQKK